MDSIKILHTGDLHLGSPMTALGPQAELRRHELLAAFGRILELAVERQVDAVLIPGDLFDSTPPSPVVQRYVADQIERVAPLPVLLATGNHDSGYTGPLPQNAHLFGSQLERITVKGAHIYGVSFPQATCPYSLIEGFTPDDPEAVNLLCLHGDLVGTGQASAYHPITPAQLAATGVDYAALGHVHTYSGVQTAGHTSYAYCGVPEGRGFDETGDKGVIIAQVAKGHTQAEFVPLCARRCSEVLVDVSTFEDYQQVLEAISARALPPDDLYKLVLTGRTNMDLQLPLLQTMLEQQYFFIKLVDRTQPDIDVEQLVGERSLRGLFVKHLTEAGGSQRALKYGLKALCGEKVTALED